MGHVHVFNFFFNEKKEKRNVLKKKKKKKGYAILYFMISNYLKKLNFKVSTIFINNFIDQCYWWRQSANRYFILKSIKKINKCT